MRSITIVPSFYDGQNAELLGITSQGHVCRKAQQIKGARVAACWITGRVAHSSRG